MQRTTLASSLALLCFALPLASLASQTAEPIGRRHQNATPLHRVAGHAVPALDHAAITADDQRRDGPGVAPRFAIPFAVDFAPETAGTWDELDEASSLWRLRIRCPGASHVNLGFARFKLPVGAQLMVYAADYRSIPRPFTGRDHNPDGQFFTPIVRGDEVVVELFVPTGQRSKVDLHLTHVGSGYRFFGANPRPQLLLGSGSCNVNVACPDGDNWRPEISSVAAISLGGSVFCSGAMINNAMHDRRNYFLTAAHCGINAGNAASLVCYWNYQETSCGASGTGTLTQYTSGATFRASYAPSDFTLVELNSAPDPTWNVGYAGWNRSSADVPSAIAIHHPSGDEKKISFENDPTTTTSYLSSTVPGAGTHIRVADWDVGTTEGGSSGSPLFDQNRRIIGQLHGGQAACGNNLADWYGRLSVSWTGGGSNDSQLANWLDPFGSGVMTVNTIGGGAPSSVPNDECSTATPISLGVNGPFSSVGATTSAPSWQSCPGGNDVWFRFIAPCTGTATFDTCSATRTFDTMIEAFSGSCGALASLGCNDDACARGSSLTINTTLGSTYFVRVGGFQSRTGVFDVTVACSGPIGLVNDECAGAIQIQDGVSPTFTNLMATTSAPSWNCGNGGIDVWFRYVATCTGSVTVDTCSPQVNFDTTLEAFRGTCGALTSLACNDDTCVRGSEVTFFVNAGSTYYLRVGGYNGAIGNFDLTVACNPLGGPATADPFGVGCVNAMRTFYEEPAPTQIDLSGLRLDMTPNTLGGYDVTRAALQWFVPTSPNLGLGDDALSVQTLPFTLAYPGGSTNRISICSNGFLWLDASAGDADFTPTIGELTAQQPRLCPLWQDLNPTTTGSIHYDVAGGVAYVTWLGVPEFGTLNANSFQCAIRPSGAIEYRYQTVGNVRPDRATIVGFSPGNGSVVPAATDLSALGQLSTAGQDLVPLQLVATTRPVLGSTLTLTTQNIPATSFGGAVLYGFTQFAGGIDLSVIGMSTCFLYTSGELTQSFAGTPSATTNLAMPNDLGFIGVHMYAQAASIAPGTTALGVITSNAIDLGFNTN